MPTSQNHDVMRPPIQSLRSARISLTSATVDVHRLVSMTRSGAAAPVLGMSEAVNQQSVARATTEPAMTHDVPFSEAAMPPAMVPIRIAAKVALSMKALPAGISAGFEQRRQNAVLDRAEERRDDAVEREREEEERHRVQQRSPAAATSAIGISARFSFSAISPLS